MHCAVEALRTGIMELWDSGGRILWELGWQSRLCRVSCFAMVQRTIPNAGGAWICAQPSSSFYVIICISLLLL